MSKNIKSSARDKYLVLSIRNLRDLLKVAELVRAKHQPGMGDECCAIYGVEALTGNCAGQLSIESVRAVGNGHHYNPTNASAGELLPYRGEFLTYKS
jgi:hypothetical protein